MTNEVLVRPALATDMAAVQAIYAHHVRHGLASFEDDPPSLEEVTRRWRDVVDRDLPYVVAEQAGDVLGYAYAGAYRTRPAYRYTLENSVYVREGVQQRGVGRAAMLTVLAACETKGYRQMIAVIGDSANVGSIRLHERLGFTRVGLLTAVGYKFGRWVDSVHMQRALGEGMATPPRG